MSVSIKTLVVSPNPPPNSSCSVLNVFTVGLSEGKKSVKLKTVDMFVKP